ncbi:hypothetical protein [Victivallis sp. Marseille-Q1083]|uniref:hypothetical protein n=1 Tax=Victivallis sp. Marseille-Q1083 TaxID=2717288 RepID=UPI00158E1DF5|nr:hypothetical protein [Victivallis sp. Marseille-Q1083]
MKTTSLRTTSVLKMLLERTAAHTGSSVSAVIKAATRGIVRGRTVIPRKITKEYYTSGPEIIPVKNLRIPAIPPEDYRKQLALRCLEELDKPSPELPVFPQREGIDYVVKESDDED